MASLFAAESSEHILTAMRTASLALASVIGENFGFKPFGSLISVFFSIVDDYFCLCYLINLKLIFS